jgi:hypothetical protein
VIKLLFRDLTEINHRNRSKIGALATRRRFEIVGALLRYDDADANFPERLLLPSPHRSLFFRPLLFVAVKGFVSPHPFNHLFCC